MCTNILGGQVNAENMVADVCTPSYLGFDRVQIYPIAFKLMFDRSQHESIKVPLISDTKTLMGLEYRHETKTGEGKKKQPLSFFFRP